MTIEGLKTMRHHASVWYRHRQLATLGCVTLTFLVGAAVGPQAATWFHRLRSARIAVSMSTVDFGDIPVGREETRTIEIKNVGGSPLLIKRVVATCGCTQVRVDRDVLPPGESSRLTISVREVRPLNGKQSVSIVSSDADQPVVTVQVLYSVKPSGLSFAPPFLDFGRAGIDNLPATTSCRTWIGASDAGRMRVATTDAWLAASLELTSAGHVDLVACLQTNAPYGPVDSFVTGVLQIAF